VHAYLNFTEIPTTTTTKEQPIPLSKGKFQVCKYFPTRVHSITLESHDITVKGGGFSSASISEKCE